MAKRIRRTHVEKLLAEINKHPFSLTQYRDFWKAKGCWWTIAYDLRGQYLKRVGIGATLQESFWMLVEELQLLDELAGEW